MNLEKVLRSFARVARPIIRRSYDAGSCVASTRISIDVLRALGFVASPLAVMLYVGNPAYRESLEEDAVLCAERPGKESSHRSCVVEVGSRLRRGDLGGHLVAVADDRFLVDASFDQVHLPEYGIVPPPILVGRVALELVGGRAAQRLDIDGLFVEYRRQPLATRFLRSPNWRASRESRASVRAILAAMDADLEAEESGHVPLAMSGGTAHARIG
jgi:hypothetical protein